MISDMTSLQPVGVDTEGLLQQTILMWIVVGGPALVAAATAIWPIDRDAFEKRAAESEKPRAKAA